MKKTLLLIAAFAGFDLLAQNSIQLNLYTSTVALVPNEVVGASTTPNGNTKVTFDIKNTSGSTKMYLAKRYDTQLNTGGDAYFCFAGNCYISMVTQSPNALTLTAGQSASQLPGQYNMLIADLDEGPAVGPSIIRYTFFNQNQVSDSIQVSIHYNVPTGMSAHSATQLSGLDLYPNPVDNHAVIRLNSSAAGDCKISVYNALGSVVNERNAVLVEGKNKIELNTESLSAGIYFASVKMGSGTVTKKFVVK